MTHDVRHRLLNRGTPRQRQMARLLARGRVRGVSPDVLALLEQADRVTKEAAAGPMTAATVHTPVADGGRRRGSRAAPHVLRLAGED